MHPRALPRRFVVVLAITLAACAPGGSPRPSSTPGSSAGSATAAPTASPSQAPSGAAIALPGCTDPYATPFRVALQFTNVRNQPSATIRHLTATSTGPLGFVVTLPETAQPEPDDIGNVAGAQSISLSFFDPDGTLTDPTKLPVMTAAAATLHVGSGPALSLTTTPGRTATVVQLPDLAAHVTLAMTLAWTDGCFTYRGEIAAQAQVALAATVAACPATDFELQKQADSLGQTIVHVGAATHLLTIEGWTAKYADAQGGEGVTPFQGTDFKSAPMAVPAGGTFVVSEGVADLTFVMVETTFYRLDQVLPDPANANPDYVLIFNGWPSDDGTVAVQVQTKPGKFVMELNVSWQTSCMTGYGREWVTVQSM